MDKVHKEKLKITPRIICKGELIDKKNGRSEKIDEEKWEIIQ